MKTLSAISKKIEKSIEENKKLKYIFITFGGECFPIVKKLQDEGRSVVVGVIQDNKDILTKEELASHKPEDPENKKARLSNYNNIITKWTADEVIEWAESVENPSEWFVFSDINNTFKYMEPLRKMGFTGLMPTEEERTLESDRNKAKEFVAKHYNKLDVAEVQEYKTIDEAVSFLDETEDIWVLKPCGEVGKTVVPQKDDPEMAKNALIDCLIEHKSDYEAQGFILERKIPNVKELTPEIVFWNGIPVFTTMDLENKAIGDGNIGCQSGCSECLVIKTDIQAKINKIAFPPIVYEMAKNHKGMFVWDASIYVDEKDQMYFGEFCANRVGWDSIFAEIVMAGSASSFFEAIVNSKNPFEEEFAVTSRVFNILPNGKMMENGLIQYDEEIEEYVFVYDMKEENERKVTTAVSWDTAIITGCGESLEESIEELYNNLDKFDFEAGYYRSKIDFLSKSYPSAIMTRYNYLLQSKLI
jgi:phosphoribosylamine-glycine ligase